MVGENFKRVGEYLAVAGGISWFLLLFSRASIMGGTICNFEGISGRIYDILGFYPPGIGFGVNLKFWVVTWNDGCNIHTTTLPGFILAVGLLSIGGYRIYRRHQANLSV